MSWSRKTIGNTYEVGKSHDGLNPIQEINGSTDPFQLISAGPGISLTDGPPITNGNHTISNTGVLTINNIGGQIVLTTTNDQYGNGITFTTSPGQINITNTGVTTVLPGSVPFVSNEILQYLSTLISNQITTLSSPINQVCKIQGYGVYSFSFSSTLYNTITGEWIAPIENLFSLLGFSVAPDPDTLYLVNAIQDVQAGIGMNVTRENVGLTGLGQGLFPVPDGIVRVANRGVVSLNGLTMDPSNTYNGEVTINSPNSTIKVSTVQPGTIRLESDTLKSINGQVGDTTNRNVNIQSNITLNVAVTTNTITISNPYVQQINGLNGTGATGSPKNVQISAGDGIIVSTSSLGIQISRSATSNGNETSNGNNTYNGTNTFNNEVDFNAQVDFSVGPININAPFAFGGTSQFSIGGTGGVSIGSGQNVTNAATNTFSNTVTNQSNTINNNSNIVNSSNNVVTNTGGSISNNGVTINNSSTTTINNNGNTINYDPNSTNVFRGFVWFTSTSTARHDGITNHTSGSTTNFQNGSTLTTDVGSTSNLLGNVNTFGTVVFNCTGGSVGGTGSFTINNDANTPNVINGPTNFNSTINAQQLNLTRSLITTFTVPITNSGSSTTSATAIQLVSSSNGGVYANSYTITSNPNFGVTYATHKINSGGYAFQIGTTTPITPMLINSDGTLTYNYAATFANNVTGRTFLGGYDAATDVYSSMTNNSTAAGATAGYVCSNGLANEFVYLSIDGRNGSNRFARLTSGTNIAGIAIQANTGQTITLQNGGNAKLTTSDNGVYISRLYTDSTFANPGTVGQFLTSGGSGSGLSWSTPGPAILNPSFTVTGSSTGSLISYQENTGTGNAGWGAITNTRGSITLSTRGNTFTSGHGLTSTATNGLEIAGQGVIRITFQGSPNIVAAQNYTFVKQISTSSTSEVVGVNGTILKSLGSGNGMVWADPTVNALDPYITITSNANQVVLSTQQNTLPTGSAGWGAINNLSYTTSMYTGGSSAATLSNYGVLTTNAPNGLVLQSPTNTMFLQVGGVNALTIDNTSAKATSIYNLKDSTGSVGSVGQLLVANGATPGFQWRSTPTRTSSSPTYPVAATLAQNTNPNIYITTNKPSPTFVSSTWTVSDAYVDMFPNPTYTTFSFRAYWNIAVTIQINAIDGGENTWTIPLPIQVAPGSYLWTGLGNYFGNTTVPLSGTVNWLDQYLTIPVSSLPGWIPYTGPTRSVNLNINMQYASVGSL